MTLWTHTDSGVAPKRTKSSSVRAIPTAISLSSRPGEVAIVEGYGVDERVTRLSGGLDERIDSDVVMHDRYTRGQPRSLLGLVALGP